MLDFKDAITFNTYIPRKNHLEVPQSLNSATKTKESDVNLDKVLQKALIKTDELDHALMDSITNSVAEKSYRRESDIVRKHGQTFLEAFLRRSKVQSAHRKALKVYIKWRNRYGNPQAGLEVAEKLSRQDVSTIIRSSRVLHFCRTPLPFCDPKKEWTVQTTQQVAKWYKNMADVLISEYSAYLEKADMQLIDFAKTDSHDESQCVIASSEFDYGKESKVDCSPAYLLSVFEGGSIICEIRVTGTFLSVTLYTLHRQYGRLDYRRFHPETRSKKRENFRNFEKNSGQFKQMIHINSFVYDFHIQYLQKALNNPNNIPSSFDIMFFIRRLALSNHIPSPFSKARIIRGIYQIQVANIDPSTFFENMFKMSTRCGFSNVILKNKFSATSVLSSNPFFDKNQKSNNTSNWEYTLVLSPFDGTDFETSGVKQKSTSKNNSVHAITIEYFVLIANCNEITPQNITKKGWSSNHHAFKDFSSLSEITLVGEGYTLTDILRGAKSKIDYIVSRVTHI
ncbi:hypothetical protein BY458DRAFT_429456 [Sporodiniella umbellata]|nr:hypothetical protein BY458DRAFT_429456 [Sporodiniella umbellata]